MVESSVFGTEVVSSYVTVPTRVKSSWRTGVDFQHVGSFTHKSKVPSSYRLSVGCVLQQQKEKFWKLLKYVSVHSDR